MQKELVTIETQDRKKKRRKLSFWLISDYDEIARRTVYNVVIRNKSYSAFSRGDALLGIISKEFPEQQSPAV